MSVQPPTGQGNARSDSQAYPRTRAVHTALQQGRLPDSVPEDRRLSARSCCRTGFPISRRRPSMIAIGRPVDSQTALIAVDLGGQERVGAALGQRDHPGLAEGRPVGPGPGVPELGRVGRGVRQVQLEPVDDQQPQAPQEPSHAPCPARSSPRARRHPIPGHRPAGPLEQLGKHPTAQPFRLTTLNDRRSQQLHQSQASRHADSLHRPRRSTSATWHLPIAPTSRFMDIGSFDSSRSVVK